MTIAVTHLDVDEIVVLQIHNICNELSAKNFNFELFFRVLLRFILPFVCSTIAEPSEAKKNSMDTLSPEATLAFLAGRTRIDLLPLSFGESNSSLFGSTTLEFFLMPKINGLPLLQAMHCPGNFELFMMHAKAP